MRTLRKQMTALVVTAIVSSTAALVAAPVAGAQGGGKKVTLQALCTREGTDGREGCSSEFTVNIRTGGNAFRVSFSEDEVGGTGDQWRAAGWEAATTATLLLGTPLTGRTIEYEITGEIDGPSAGALITVGVIAVLRGDKVDPAVTMSGTINPDGTIGPVGGIPAKVDGAIEAEKTVMLIPEGQRNSIDPNTGELVDVVDLGAANDIEVQEVADIYEAYEAFTGVELPRLEGGDTELSSRAYDRLENLRSGWVSEYQSSASAFGALDPAVFPFVSDLAFAADEAATRSDQLATQGIQAGAYLEGVRAAAFANAAVKTAQAVQVFFTQGVDAFISQIESSAAVGDKAQSFFDGLEGFQPKTLSEASGLIDAYGNAIDAISLSNQGDAVFDTAASAAPEQIPDLLVYGAQLKELAGTIIEAAEELQDFTAEFPGPRVRAADVDAIADFFRKGAQANLEALDSILIPQIAAEAGVSEDIAKTALAETDSEYLLAQQGSGTIGDVIDEFVQDERSAAYANLGGAAVLYSRSATLLAKYYSLGAQTDDFGNVIAVAYEQPLTNMLEMGEEQGAGVIGVLRDRRADPAALTGGFEIATVDREGDPQKKFEALAGFFSTYIGGRLLAYLGGFEEDGLT